MLRPIWPRAQPQICRVDLASRPFPSILYRSISRYEAYDASFDPDDLAEARKWQRSFQEDSIPKGNTTFARSSGPGGQHVNKTETKAITAWPVKELLGFLPKLMHTSIRSSRYYSKANDSLSIQAQTQRSRTANADENRQKLFEELQKIYRDAVPGETDPAKKHKYEALEKTFHSNRVREKKQQGSKKAFRKGGGSDY